MTIYQQMQVEKQNTEDAIAFIESKLAELPEGQLICTKDQKWYRHIGDKKIYIAKADHAVAEDLASKKYFEAVCKDLKRKLQGINYFLKNNNPDLDIAPKLLTHTSKYSQLLSPLFDTSNEDLAAWVREPYPKNTKYPQQLKYETVNGLYVRSKSEAMIALLLSEQQIPFRYEDALTLDGCTIHPDFTLRHPQTGETFYWEHCGRIDQPQYRSMFYKKIQLYMENDILPPRKLILTWETNLEPLSLGEIRHQIETHFGAGQSALALY